YECAASFAAEVEADEAVFSAGVVQAVREGGVGAGVETEDLRAGDHVVLLGGRAGENQLAFLGKDEELVTGQHQCPCAEVVLGPTDLAGLPFDAAEVGAFFLTAVEAEE